ncbi:membrane-spanning 4-domains subfamily A member 15-like isoform X6 [Malaclemys terrapin pileata]|uniref:membrane-spanning 4-domains subfamily A member 15-like isoform X6 n=1 Tax=Malaclemys terrapin pileata TaxID=2991368 RepID=UPI0023A88C27|nr:membrane-spanning 4-domains subfamily A member 15-like isoform X6 [Malaclemys terrapin pileata]
MATTVTAGSAGPITIVNRFITQPHMASAAIPAKLQPLEKFHKGEPLALGITQILVGAMQFAVGMVMAMVNSYFWILALSVHVPIWSGLLYIISGALSVAAAKNPKIQLVKGSLGMNIISSVLAGCAMILYLVSLMESREFNSFLLAEGNHGLHHGSVPVHLPGIRCLHLHCSLWVQSRLPEQLQRSVCGHLPEHGASR